MADLQIVMSSDEARVMRALDKVIQKEKDLAIKGLEAGQATARGAKEAENALDKMATKVAAAAKAMSPWQNATDVLRTGFEAVLDVVERVVQRQKEAAAFVGSSAKGLEGLGEQAGGDPARAKALSAHVRRIYPKVGGSDMNEAAKLVSEVVAAGFEDDATIDYAAELYHTLGGRAGQAATGIAGLQKSMGVGETGDFRQVMAKAVEAAGPMGAPGGVPEVLKYISKSGGQAKALGMSDEELFSVFSAVSATAASSEQGGTQTSALLGKAIAAGHHGPIMDFVKKLQAEGVPVGDGKARRMSTDTKDVFAFLEDNAFRAYNAAINNADDIRAGTVRLGGLGAVDLAGASNVDPSVRAERAYREAQASEALSAEEQGVTRRMLDRQIALEAFDARTAGSPEWAVQARQKLSEFERDSPLIYGAAKMSLAPLMGPLLGTDNPLVNDAVSVKARAAAEEANALMREQNQLMRREDSASGRRVIPGADR